MVEKYRFWYFSNKHTWVYIELILEREKTSGVQKSNEGSHEVPFGIKFDKFGENWYACACACACAIWISLPM